MSTGKCGEHYYENITHVKIDQIIDALKKNGSTVSGNNPWDVDTNKFGIKLRGTWNEGSSTLILIVTDKDFYIPCAKIWETIDPMIQSISSLQEGER